MNPERFIVHVPAWLRWGMLALLGALVIAFSISFFIGLNRPGFSNWSMAAASIVQIALAGLAYIALLFFTESAQSPDALQKKADFVLLSLLPERLRRITDMQDASMQVAVRDRPSGIVGRIYELASPDARLKLWVGLNVRRVIVAYFCARPDALNDEQFLQLLRRVFHDTTGGAEAVGYDPPHLQLESVGVERFGAIWLTWDMGKDGRAGDFLTHAPSQLFFAQDVALMTQSFVRTAQRAGLTLWTDTDPTPL